MYHVELLLSVSVTEVGFTLGVFEALPAEPNRPGTCVKWVHPVFLSFDTADITYAFQCARLRSFILANSISSLALFSALFLSFRLAISALISGSAISKRFFAITRLL